jgi:hypothetical protein
MLGASWAIMWRLRFSLRASFKRITRCASRGMPGNSGHVAGRKLKTDNYAMEEDHANGGVPRSSPPFVVGELEVWLDFQTAATAHARSTPRVLVPFSCSTSPTPKTSVRSKTSSQGVAQASPKPSPRRSSPFPLPAPPSSVSLLVLIDPQPQPPQLYL